MPGTHAIVSTHTWLNLRRTLLGLAAQSRPPASLIVSCDTDDAKIAEVVAQVARDCSVAITLVQRPHQGQSRSSQVRNNAVRALLASTPAPADLLWFLDGDCIPAPDALAAHEELSASPSLREGAGGRVGEGVPPGRLVVAFRIDLLLCQTNDIDQAALRAARPFIELTPPQLQVLRYRQRRYQRHAFLRRLGLGKPHKPKLLSANFSVHLADYLAVNGFDEEYLGYGQEDDDLGRRLYAIGVKPVIGVTRAVVYHQHHPTRAPAAWDKSPNADRFAQPFTPRCAHGVENPLAQPTPTITLCS